MGGAEFLKVLPRGIGGDASRIAREAVHELDRLELLEKSRTNPGEDDDRDPALRAGAANPRIRRAPPVSRHTPGDGRPMQTGVPNGSPSSRDHKPLLESAVGIAGRHAPSNGISRATRDAVRELLKRDDRSPGAQARPQEQSERSTGERPSTQPATRLPAKSDVQPATQPGVGSSIQPAASPQSTQPASEQGQASQSSPDQAPAKSLAERAVEHRLNELGPAVQIARELGRAYRSKDIAAIDDLARQREKLSPEEQSEIIEAFRLQNGGKHPLTFFDQQRHYKVGDDSRYVRASIAEMLAQWERVGYCPPISDFGVRERSKVLGEERPSKEQRMLVHALYAALHEHNRIIQAVIPRDTYKNNGEIFNALNNQIKQGGRDPMEVYDCMEKIFNKQGRIGVAEAVSVLDARLRALPQEGNGVVHVGNSAIAMFAKAGLNTDQAMVQIYGEEAIQLCRTILDAGSPEEIATARQAADDKTYRLACYYAEVNGELLTPKVSLALHAVDQ